MESEGTGQGLAGRFLPEGTGAACAAPWDNKGSPPVSRLQRACFSLLSATWRSALTSGPSHLAQTASAPCLSPHSLGSRCFLSPVRSLAGPLCSHPRGSSFPTRSPRPRTQDPEALSTVPSCHRPPPWLLALLRGSRQPQKHALTPERGPGVDLLQPSAVNETLMPPGRAGGRELD